MNNIRRVALLFAVITPVHAAPITYNINFNTGSGIAPVSGGFTYDGSTSTFTSFTVIWDGMTFDFTRPLRAGLDTCGVPQTEAGEFQLLMGISSCTLGNSWNAGVAKFGPDQSGGLFNLLFLGSFRANAQLGMAAIVPTTPAANAGGTFTIEQAAPEPSSGVMGASAAMTLIMVARWRKRLQAAKTPRRALLDGGLSGKKP